MPDEGGRMYHNPDKELLKQALKELFKSGEVKITMGMESYMDKYGVIYPVIAIDDDEVYSGPGQAVRI